MSEARDKFFELLCPSIEPYGYAFNKSKSCFYKNINSSVCTILFSWDGRGGVTFINNIGLQISYDYVAKSLKTLLKIKEYPLFFQFAKGRHFDSRIPQMNSKELYELANNMAFKKMAAMSFEEKYPIERIKNTVAKAAGIIIEEIIPVHNEWADEHKILQFKIDTLLARLNEIDTHNIMWEILFIKIMSKKLNITEPKFVADINIFTNKSIDDLWNMQDYDFENMEAKFNQLKF